MQANLQPWNTRLDALVKLLEAKDDAAAEARQLAVKIVIL